MFFSPRSPPRSPVHVYRRFAAQHLLIYHLAVSSSSRRLFFCFFFLSLPESGPGVGCAAAPWPRAASKPPAAGAMAEMRCASVNR